MDINSFVIGFKKGKASGGGGFPVNEFFARTATELTLTGVERLGQYSFYQYTTLEKLYLPDTIEIASGAISICNNLSDIVMAEGLITIGGSGTSAISGSPLLRALEIPSTVETVNWNALVGCTNLETVTFLGKPKMIGSEFNSTALPASVKTINANWAYGEVEGAPWGASSATIHYTNVTVRYPLTP